MIRRRAFTLIELLVVVAIIGILATVVIVNVSSAQTKAKDAKVKSDLATIQTAANLYFLDSNNYSSLNCSNIACTSLSLSNSDAQNAINKAAADINQVLVGNDGLTIMASQNSYQAFAKMPSTLTQVSQQTLSVSSSGGVSTVAATAAAQLNGTNQYFSNNNPIFLANNSFSFWGWFKMDSIPSSYASIFSKGDAGGSGGEYMFRVNGPDGHIQFCVRKADDSGANCTSASFSPVSTSTWYFFAAWYDSQTQTISYKINNDTAYTGAGVNGIYQGTNLFEIGGNQFFPGKIDNTGFAKRVLTSDEMTALYNSGRGLNYANWPSSLTQDAAPIINPSTNNGGFETLTTGGNMLSYYNADMEGTNNWGQRTSSSSISPDTTQHLEGLQSLKVVTSNTQTGEGCEESSVSIDPSTQYTASAYVKGSGTVQMNLVERDVNTVALNSNTSSVLTLTGSWQRITATGLFNHGGVKASIIISTPTQQGITFYVDEAQLEVGPSALGWTQGGQAHFANWGNNTTGASSITLDAATPLDGSNAIKLTTDSSGSFCQIYQSVLTVGKRYKISLYAKKGTGGESIFAGANQPNGIDFTPTSTYAQYTGYFTADVSALQIKRADGVANSELYIDDVNVEEVPLISEWDFEANPGFLVDMVTSSANNLTNNGNITAGLGISGL